MVISVIHEYKINTFQKSSHYTEYNNNTDESGTFASPIEAEGFQDKQHNKELLEHALNSFASMIILIPRYGSSSDLSKQSTVMRNEIQQSRVHQLQTVRTRLHHLFYYHLKEENETRAYCVKVIK